MGSSMERETKLKRPLEEGSEDSVVRGSLDPSCLCFSLQLYSMCPSVHQTIFSFLVALRTEPKALWVLGKPSTAELRPQTLFYFSG